MVDFQFYLNRQGPQGPQGEVGPKGEDGNTPTTREGTNNSTTYTVIFDSGDGNVFETGNLRYPIVDRGGTTLKYDRTAQTQYLGDPDPAEFNGGYGVVKLAYAARVANEDVEDTDAVSYKLFKDNDTQVRGLINTSISAISQLNTRYNTLNNNVTQLANTVSVNTSSIENLRFDLNTLSQQKADTSYVNIMLNNKSNVGHTHTLNQITNAGTLAGKNSVDYRTEVTNTPNLGSLAAKDTVNYTTEVDNKPTIGDGVITIYQDGSLVDSFSVNQTGNKTINLLGGSGGGGGTTYAPGDGINISAQDVISVKIDNDTMSFNQNGELVANLEDLSDYYTKTETDDLLDDKQDLLVAGSNITLTDNGDGTTIISSTGGSGGGTSLTAGDNIVFGKHINNIVDSDGTLYPLNFNAINLTNFDKYRETASAFATNGLSLTTNSSDQYLEYKFTIPKEIFDANYNLDMLEEIANLQVDIAYNISFNFGLNYTYGGMSPELTYSYTDQMNNVDINDTISLTGDGSSDIEVAIRLNISDGNFPTLTYTIDDSTPVVVNLSNYSISIYGLQFDLNVHETRLILNNTLTGSNELIEKPINLNPSDFSFFGWHFTEDGLESDINAVVDEPGNGHISIWYNDAPDSKTDGDIINSFNLNDSGDTTIKINAPKYYDGGKGVSLGKLITGVDTGLTSRTIDDAISNNLLTVQNLYVNENRCELINLHSDSGYSTSITSTCPYTCSKFKMVIPKELYISGATYTESTQQFARGEYHFTNGNSNTLSVTYTINVNPATRKLDYEIVYSVNGGASNTASGSYSPYFSTTPTGDRVIDVVFVTYPNSGSLKILAMPEGNTSSTTVKFVSTTSISSMGLVLDNINVINQCGIYSITANSQTVARNTDVCLKESYIGVYGCSMENLLFNYNKYSNMSNRIFAYVGFTYSGSDTSFNNGAEAYIVKTYVNGKSWYRIYSDGWCEQGGYATATGSTSAQQIALLKNFANTDYSVFITRTVDADSFWQVTVTEQTVSSFKTGYSCDKYWRACGYLGSGQW